MTRWPLAVSSRTVEGTKPTRYSLSLISFGTPTSIVQPPQKSRNPHRGTGTISIRRRNCSIRVHRQPLPATARRCSATNLHPNHGEPSMAIRVADQLAQTLKAAGVERVWGIVGDSLNGFTEALRTTGIRWMHVR